MKILILAFMLVAIAGCAATKDANNSQAGWRLKTSTVNLFITANGGHMAPVEFCIDTGPPIQPYYISPWQNERLTGLPDRVLIPLRGDFFCMPFGANAEAVGREVHSAHGEVASSQWSFASRKSDGMVNTLVLRLATKVRKGLVTKRVHLVDGHNAVYISHTLEGYSGKMPIGHHCTLALPEEEGSLRAAVSPFALGMTCPVVFSNPANRAYQSLAVNAEFTDLTKVPTIWKDPPAVDCSIFPARPGFTDLLQLFRKPSSDPAWTVATCQKAGYLWFSLKDAAVMPGTVFWISNKGQHGFPWNGRNRCLGLEETRAYFAQGLGPSIGENIVNRKGFPTAITLSPEKPTVVRIVQGVVRIPPGFENVKTVTFAKGTDYAPGTVTFVSTTGKEVAAEVDHEFLDTGKLRAMHWR